MTVGKGEIFLNMFLPSFLFFIIIYDELTLFGLFLQNFNPSLLKYEGLNGHQRCIFFVLKLIKNGIKNKMKNRLQRFCREFLALQSGICWDGGIMASEGGVLILSEGLTKKSKKSKSQNFDS